MTQAWPGETPSSGGEQLDLGAAVGRPQQRRPRLARRAHANGHLHPVADRGERSVAEPVHVGDADRAGRQRLARADDDARPLGIEPHHVERLADRQAEAAPLTDGVVDDAAMAAEHPAVDMDDRRPAARRPASDAR